MLGTERTGPDLSQEGGVHTDEWHLAHFHNPRYTSPKSIMPQFSFYYYERQADTARQEINELIAYVQSLGGQAATSAPRARGRSSRSCSMSGRRATRRLSTSGSPRPGATCATRWSRRSAR